MDACEIRILTEDDWATWREVRLRSQVDALDAFGSKLADWQAFVRGTGVGEALIRTLTTTPRT